ncbi:hypothetical protein AN958_07622 [Leucoagaricus sp. SymC.cos]|nr:hypothetical protein AN958_07622 [Leucoagaricus sp. SymC.cos]
MLLASLGFGPRLCSFTRQHTRTLMNRTATRPIPDRKTFPPPPNKPSADGLQIKTSFQFLTAIGRSCQEKVEAKSWENFWKMSGEDMKKAGLAVKDRRYVVFHLEALNAKFIRYILWCMEKYRFGYDPRSFAHEAKPKKKVRGWGPKVQNGKRIRSRRLKN